MRTFLRYKRIWLYGFGFLGPLSLLLVLSSSCGLFVRSDRPAGTISLLDQIPADQPAGPWRVVADLRVKFTIAEEPVRFRLKNIELRGSNLIQTGELSSFTIDTDVRAGEDVFVVLIYRRSQSVVKWVKAVTDRNGDIRKDRILNPERIAVLKLAARDSDTGQITLVHLGKKGQPLPLESVILLAAAKDIAPHDISRLHRILSIKDKSFLPNFPQALAWKYFASELNGSTHGGLVLTAGDSVHFSVPHGIDNGRLSFWTAPIEGEGYVLIDAESGGQWIKVDTNENMEEGPPQWRRWDLPIRNAYADGRLSFSIPEEDSATAVLLAEPMIFPIAVEESKKKNLIIVDLDTVRADRLGCYGYDERQTSARLDSIMAAKGFFIFSRAYSSAPWTLPATARFLTGRYLSNYPWYSSEIGILRDCDTLAEILRSHGYYCAAFTGGSQLRKDGFERGFHEYYWSFEHGKIEVTIHSGEKWLSSESTEPFFLFLHTYEAHHPYTRGNFCVDLPRGRLGNLNENEELLPRMLTTGVEELSSEESLYVQAAYDGGVRAACDATARLFETMDDLGLWENTVVVILSDHGEELWDHSESYVKHGHSLYGELLDVPFMIYTPEMSTLGLTRIYDTVGTIDLVPTILELFDMRTGDSFDGISLVPLMKGKEVERAYPVIASNWLKQLGRPPKFALFADGWKYIENDRMKAEWARIMDGKKSLWNPLYCPDPHEAFSQELYWVQDDPLEMENRAEKEIPLTMEMREILDHALTLSGLSGALDDYSRGHVAREKPRRGLSSDLEAQLRKLGYIE